MFPLLVKCGITVAKRPVEMLGHFLVGEEGQVGQPMMTLFPLPGHVLPLLQLTLPLLLLPLPPPRSDNRKRESVRKY